MFGTIRRHQKWLWAVIITLTVISFVIYFSPYSKINSGERRGPMNLGTINGQRISEETFWSAEHEIALRYFIMNGGRAPDEETRRNFERDTLQWLFLINKQEQAGIHISPDKVAEIARNMVLSSFQRSGAGNVSPEGAARLLEANGFQSADLERYVQHYLGMQELLAAVGVSGKLATPEEISELYVREHQELATEAAIFHASNYLAGVTVTPQALSQFFSNQMAEYRIPERVQVSYVKFPVTNAWASSEQYWAKTNLNEIVEANYQRLGTNYFKDAKTPDQVRAKLREELIRQHALLQVRKEANEFARPLFDLKEPHTQDLVACAKTNGLKVEVAEPFDQDHTPKGLDVDEDFATAAFRLTPDQPLGGPLVGRDGVYVIGLDKRLPEEKPPLDQIRDRVTADFKLDQARSMARQAGIAFHRGLTNSLAQGQGFDAICAGAKLKPVSLPPFSLSSRELPGVDESINQNMLKQVAFGTPVGKVSGFQWTADGGFVLFVKSKVPMDEAKMKADLPAFAQGVRQQWQNEAFNEWFGQQFVKSVHSPLLERKEPPPNLSARKARKS
ncbi:MAG: peptidyl-prolyl cis-trans isomerase [Limisphaerales bacterium]